MYGAYTIDFTHVTLRFKLCKVYIKLIRNLEEDRDFRSPVKEQTASRVQSGHRRNGDIGRKQMMGIMINN